MTNIEDPPSTKVIHHHHHHHHYHFKKKVIYKRPKKEESGILNLIIEKSCSRNRPSEEVVFKDDALLSDIEKKNDSKNEYSFHDLYRPTTILAEANIRTIDDLIRVGKLYLDPEFSGKNYSFNVKGIYEMTGVLEELKMFIGMEECKKKIVQQIVYFSQNLYSIKQAGEQTPVVEPEKKSNILNIFGIPKPMDYSKEYNCKEETIDNDDSDFLNTVIRGSPGVGKTMFAKILSRIYLCLGITTKSTFRIIKRTDLIGEYLGHTAVKTQKAINEAMGGVLFIDEAYSLGTNSKNGDSYSKECIDVLTQNLSEHKGKFICIIAGYKDELERYFFSLNPGLRRRFSFYYDLENYNYDELCDIFLSKFKRMHEWKVDELCVTWLKTSLFFSKKEDFFPFYGGDIDNLVTRIKISHSLRVFGRAFSEQKIITREDVENGFRDFKDEYEKNKKKSMEEEYLEKGCLNMYI